MYSNKYKNIQLTTEINNANCITHSGKFHVDDVISTIFLSKIIDDVVLLRIPSIGDKDVKNKIVYDIGLGKFDHHQKNRNGKRDNGIYYSAIGLLWKEFGKKYLKKIGVKYIDKTFEYMDKELIQNIDAADNMQFEYVENKISPDFIKLFNPVWNEDILEDEAFINALRLADEFWEIYMKNAISKIEGIEVISNKVAKCKEDYIIFDKEMPYKEATQLFAKNKIKYIILKSRREGYEIRIIANKCRFKDEIVLSKDINNSKKITEINDLKYVDNHGKLCCTETLDSAIKLIKYNENKI